VTGRRFAYALGAIVVAALALRIVYTSAVTAHPEDHPYDELYYVVQSDAVASGRGFLAPFSDRPAADHPPLTTLVVTPATAVFGLPADTLPQRLTMCIVGAVTVGLIGLLGRVLGGAAVGLTAAVIAAVYPNLFVNDGIVMAEALTAALMTGALLLVYRLRASWSPWVAAGLGGVAALAALTRAELILLLPVLVVPAVLGADRSVWRSRLRLVGLALGTAVLVMAPWVVRNLVTFREPTFLSSGDGAVLAGANCDRTYSGRFLGVWSVECSTAVRPADDGSVVGKRQRDRGLSYAEDHLGRVPVVVGARLGRAFDVFRPFQTVQFGELEGRPHAVGVAGVLSYWVLLPLAVVGAVLVRRARRAPLWPMLVPFGIVVVVVALGYGITRFRVPAEPSLVVLAAITLCAGWRHVGGTATDQPAAAGPSTIDASSSS
jgi:4-amino-4-deoxy-L-arabinose transferase-like glycosyltransferase